MVYAEIPRGVVFEKLASKAEHLAWQRPTWSVYEGEAEPAIAAGVAAHLPVSLLDVDPYGDAWPAIEAFFSSDRLFPEQLAIAVNDGLRQKLKMGGGWTCRSMQLAIQQFGNAALYARYAEVCRWNLARIADARGYAIDEWTVYHCGHAEAMTHYGALLHR